MDEQPETTTTTQPADDGLSRSAIAKLIAAVALVGVFVIFAAQNTASTEVEFLAWSFTTRQIILMVGSAAAGVAVWELFTFVRRRSRRSRR